jgi:hypothetical protein
MSTLVKIVDQDSRESLATAIFPRPPAVGEMIWIQERQHWVKKAEWVLTPTGGSSRAEVSMRIEVRVLGE